MGEIENVHDPEDQGETCRHEEEYRPVGQSAEKLRK